LKALIARFDEAVDSAFDRWRGNRVADHVFYSASALGDHSLIWLILAALRALRSERDWKPALRAAIGIGAESALVNLGVKSLFRRRRPQWDEERPRRLRQPRTSSFPSGHATAGFCAAALLSEDDPAWPLYYLAALVVAASRVYVRIHHASDVVAGIAIGALLGRLARRLVPITPQRALSGSGQR
jgi:undecaprenyl-diphosphatase